MLRDLIFYFADLGEQTRQTAFGKEDSGIISILWSKTGVALTRRIVQASATLAIFILRFARRIPNRDSTLTIH